jgi:pimeloyl-ACP methyl ester carboxylesterase
VVVARRTALGELVLRGEAFGEGLPVVGLHGLTATRRNVFHGSLLLARSGTRLVTYDARGHGDSDPAPRRDAYGYDELVDDLEAVVATVARTPPLLVGVSMGAATALAAALRSQVEAAGLVLVTPPALSRHDEPIPVDELAAALEVGDLDRAASLALPAALAPRWRAVAHAAVRQRFARHRQPRAVADALRVVSRSPLPFAGGDLARLELPVLVVGSRDDADPLHPLADARELAAAIPAAEFVVEDEGRSPLAWQGAQLARVVLAFAERHGLLSRGR